MAPEEISGSFRDPSGFLFTLDGTLYRQVNHAYADHYAQLMASGLYDALVKAERLIPHDEVDVPPAQPAQAWKIIQPERVGFVSYPYEWSFSQLKDAAALTLAVQQTALEHGMSLKDCSAYNVQFHRGRAVFIDTLSFEPYAEGRPWVAYRQFCRHFLAPLALASRRDVRLNQLSRIYMDGVPLDLASRLLGWTQRLSPGIWFHIHLHARLEQRHQHRPADIGGRQMSRFAFNGLLDSLSTGVRKCRPPARQTACRPPEASAETITCRKAIVERFLDKASPRTCWDLRVGDGTFSRLAADRGIQTVSFDADPAVVESQYLQVKEDGQERILPLVMDLGNPSGSIGWANAERMSLAQRAPTDALIAINLVHLLAISNNVPLGSIAAYMQTLARTLIIEFAPKADAEVAGLLTGRDDVFDEYDRDHFEEAFGRHFTTEAQADIEGTSRTVYVMRACE